MFNLIVDNSLGVLLWINYTFHRVHLGVYDWMKWFLWMCMLHGVMDILTHHDDGPLLLFPFEWTVRYYSPVSYWDSNHYGKTFSVFERCFNIFLLIYLVQPYFLSVLIRIKQRVVRNQTKRS